MYEYPAGKPRRLRGTPAGKVATKLALGVVGIGCLIGVGLHVAFGHKLQKWSERYDAKPTVTLLPTGLEERMSRINELMNDEKTK